MIINPKDTRILIVGLGLLGGSYAMSLSRQGYDVRTITRSQGSIDYALENKLVTYGTTEVTKELVGWANLIVFALYPHVFVEWIEQYGSYINKGTIITDVTGVKYCIAEKIQNLLPGDVEFIPAHPMAGREVYGVQNSDERIFKVANYIVTPTKKNTSYAIEVCKELGQVLGFAHIAELSPEDHDEMIAFLSQLTHCIAVALMNANDNESISLYTGDSFRDLTRIARINENMWSELFLLNKDALVREIENFQMQLDKLKKTIVEEDTDTMKEMMKISTKRRALFDKK